LLFGSLGRGERARDLDLLVVADEPEVEHAYQRLSIDARQVDLNVATRGWLGTVWEDPEWGYCLSEAYLLGHPPRALEMAWETAVLKYNQPRHRRRCARSHVDLAGRLFEVSIAASRSGQDAAACLLAHEALRLASMPLIECFGRRVYSHQSFFDEVRDSARRAGITGAATREVLRALGQRDDPDPGSYVAIRRSISTVMRGLHGYDVSLPRERRIEALIALSHGTNVLDEAAKSAALLDRFPCPEWLPAGYAQAVRISSEAMERHERLARLASSSRPRDHHLETPVRSSTPGARWVDASGDRLKIILATSGCQTPTCVFCTLPLYGRQTEPAASVAVVGRLVREHRPRRLSLYNDGSLLNPAELSPKQLREIVELAISSEVRVLDVETVPRFVTRDRIADLATAGFESVSVAMGLQTSEDWLAVGLLGRPDPLAIFERALSVLRECQVSARLYLLWGHGVVSTADWEGSLRSSLAWASARAVERVTICPYVSPAADTPPGPTLCELRRQLAAFSPGDMVVDVSLAETPSCGVANLPGCIPCATALRSGQYSRGPACAKTPASCLPSTGA